MTTWPEVGASPAAETLAFELHDTQLQLGPIFQRGFKRDADRIVTIDLDPCKLSYCCVENGGADFGSVDGPFVPRKFRYRTSSEAMTRVAGPELPLLACQNQPSVAFPLLPQGVSSPLVLLGLLPKWFSWPFCHPLGAKFAPPPMMTACPSYRGLSASHPWRCR